MFTPHAVLGGQSPPYDVGQRLVMPYHSGLDVVVVSGSELDRLGIPLLVNPDLVPVVDVEAVYDFAPHGVEDSLVVLYLNPAHSDVHYGIFILNSFHWNWYSVGVRVLP